MRRRPAALALVVAMAAGISACTPGAATTPSSLSRSPISGAIIVHVSLLKYGPSPSTFGTVAGYSPNPLTVSVGSIVQFVNDDNFTHTASFVSTTGFPVGNPLSSAAQTPSGTDLASAGWSSGNILGGAFSQGFTASTAGTYYYGCFYHYGSPMRGVIVVQ